MPERDRACWLCEGTRDKHGDRLTDPRTGHRCYDCGRHVHAIGGARIVLTEHGSATVRFCVACAIAAAAWGVPTHGH